MLPCLEKNNLREKPAVYSWLSSLIICCHGDNIIAIIKRNKYLSVSFPSEEDGWHFSSTNIVNIKARDSARFLNFKKDIESPVSFKRAKALGR